jgi:gliding-associated putative ABC transporter substrate-binding component GldG
VGNVGKSPQVKLLTWPFYPLINNFSDHPIVKNMDAVYTRFTGTIDTVKAPGIKRTPLMSTSRYSMILPAPVHVSVNELKKELKPEFFNAGPQTISWIAEGPFISLYKNHFIPDGMDEMQFIADGMESKIMVVSDGDVARNDFNPDTGAPLELGVDPFTQTKFANAEFLLNTLA